MSNAILQAADSIARGGVVIYPTETLYALGTSITSLQAVERISDLKQRDRNKPLPVIIGALDQLDMITEWKDAELSRLIRNFWPGPLSILVPARHGLSRLIQDAHGFVAVRWTSHSTAQALALHCRAPLVATSANPGGEPAAGRPQDLDPALVEKVDMVVDLPPYPAGGLPSTVVQILADGRLKIFREGAVTSKQLQEAGWQIS
ncbi:L-threonylcarbamoyladenylate synthase [Desulfonatronum thiosulfatophilum]|uniref:L-threonylcarbamoyladenylate synthase n=1 Tax=Desulfonatronum thiosulfatophilum TaxID=617002 RepID=A0A1G6DAS3_9BACT|nr:L-threonylcarbamoyladenylate synthase [Desulfonatronum thiosulfatophilum]SDB42228.1 L-threonylcarbamoyladenylate synthase [Desulfonatronum thiosulfatophilum]